LANASRAWVLSLCVTASTTDQCVVLNAACGLWEAELPVSALVIFNDHRKKRLEVTEKCASNRKQHEQDRGNRGRQEKLQTPKPKLQGSAS